jgi:molybdopterin converting factor small subunit
MAKYASGLRVFEPTGATVGAVLDDLSSTAGELVDVVRRDGRLARYVNLYVNGEDVRELGGLGAVVRDGDEITILPAVAGG